MSDRFSLVMDSRFACSRRSWYLPFHPGAPFHQTFHPHKLLLDRWIPTPFPTYTQGKHAHSWNWRLPKVGPSISKVVPRSQPWRKITTSRIAGQNMSHESAGEKTSVEMARSAPGSLDQRIFPRKWHHSIQALAAATSSDEVLEVQGWNSGAYWSKLKIFFIPLCREDKLVSLIVILVN